MTKENLYRYLGRNGILTTRILLDGINHISLVELRADSGKILTNGDKMVYIVVVDPEEVSQWREITDKTK